MAEVDVYDDDIRRFVVRRYAYDAARHERRHQVVGVYDSELEYQAALRAASSELQRRRESGEDVDPQEHISGIVLDPGYHRKQQNGRVIKRAIAHGANLKGEMWDGLANDLPPGMAVFRFESDAGA